MSTPIYAQMNPDVEAGIELPSRQLLYLTTAPADCEQVVVLFGGWSVQPQLPGLVSCMQARWCGTFGVMISRKTPALPQRDGQPRRGHGLRRKARHCLER